MERADVWERIDLLRAVVARLWHSHHPAWWYRLVARAGVAHLTSFLILAPSAMSAVAAFRHERPFAEITPADFDRAWRWSYLGAVAFTIYSYRTMNDPEPPEERVPGDGWGSRANDKGMWLAFGVFYTTLLLCLHLFWGISEVSTLLPVLPHLLDVAVGFIGLGLCFPLPVILAVRAYRERVSQEIEVLESVTPPGLRLAIGLHRRADWFHAHAGALERAMEQAAEVSRQVQHEIILEHQQLGELHEQALRQARLNEITPEQAAAVAHLLDQQHAEGERRSRRSSFRHGLLWFVLGVATNLIPEAVWDQLRQWLHLG